MARGRASDQTSTSAHPSNSILGTRKCQSLPGNGTLYGHDVYPTKKCHSVGREKAKPTRSEKQGQDLGQSPGSGQVSNSHCSCCPHVYLPLHGLASQSFIHVKQPSLPPFNSFFGPRWVHNKCIPLAVKNPNYNRASGKMTKFWSYAWTIPAPSILTKTNYVWKKFRKLQESISSILLRSS